MSSRITLSEKTLNASSFVVVTNLLARILDLLGLVVLARILTPADFGLVAMAMTFIVMAETMFAIPIGTGIVRAKAASKSLCDTAFTLGLVRGLVIALLLGLLSYPVSKIYNDDRLFLLLLTLSIAPIARGLINPRVFLLHRRMDFRLTSLGFFVGRFFALVIGIIVGYSTKSYWAIAVISITSPIILVLISYLFVPYRPHTSFRRFNEFSDILSWSTLSQFFSALSWQSDRLILGGLIPQDLFGRYAMAANLASMPTQILLIPIVRPLSASLAQLKDKDKLRSAYLRTSQTVVLLVMPMLLSGFFFGEAIIMFLFGENWKDTVLIFQLLCLIYLIAMPVNVFPILAIVLRKTKLIAIASAADTFLRVFLLIMGTQAYGVYGALSALAVAATLRLAVQSYMTKRVLDCSISKQILCQKRNVVYGIVFAVVAYFAREIIAFDSVVTHLSTLGAAVALSLLAYAMSGFLVYKHFGKPAGPEKSLYDLATKVLVKIAANRR